MPEFVLKENRRDICGRKIGDENYDPTTLFIDQKDYKKLTPMMK